MSDPSFPGVGGGGQMWPGVTGSYPTGPRRGLDDLSRMQVGTTTIFFFLLKFLLYVYLGFVDWEG